MTQTSNAPATKAAIIEALSAATGLDGVDVAYSWNRNLGRECVYGGHIQVQQSVNSGRDLAGSAGREERATIDIHIRVDAIGEDVRAAEARAAEIGAALEAYIAVWRPVADGLLAVEVTGYDLITDFDDDGAFALLTYPVETESHLI